MPARPSLLETFSLIGEFWFPERPDRKAVGRLNFDPDERVIAQLDHEIEDGPLTPPSQRTKNNRPDVIWGRDFGPPLLLGHTENGEYCTIFGARNASHTFGGAGISRAQYGATSLLLGAHVGADEAFCGDCEARITNLEQWLGHYPFSSEWIREGTQLRGQLLRYVHPELYHAD